MAARKTARAHVLLVGSLLFAACGAPQRHDDSADDDSSHDDRCDTACGHVFDECGLTLDGNGPATQAACLSACASGELAEAEVDCLGAAACTSDAMAACLGCVPATCVDRCGDVADGCGGTLHCAPCGSCEDECAAGEKRCDDGLVVTCGEADDDECLEWGAPTACDARLVCVAGECVEPPPTCENDCTAGATRCDGNGVSTCADRDANGCTEWGPSVACEGAQRCASGRCDLPPIAAFTCPAGPELVGAAVSFSASGSYDPTGSIVSYAFSPGPAIAETVGTASSWTHAYAAAGSYEARLVLTDDGGLTTTATCTVVVAEPVGAPANLKAEADDGEVRLTWDPVPGAISYGVHHAHFAMNGDPRTGFGPETVTGTSFTKTGLNNGTPYSFIVVANGAAGPGPASAEVSATPAEMQPPSPVSATAAPGQVTLSWPAVPGATGYRVYVGKSAEPRRWWGDAALKGEVTATGFVASNLENGTRYHFDVSAVGPRGETDQVTSVSATPDHPPIDFDVVPIMTSARLVSSPGYYTFWIDYRIRNQGTVETPWCFDVKFFRHRPTQPTESTPADSMNTFCDPLSPGETSALHSVRVSASSTKPRTWGTAWVVLSAVREANTSNNAASMSWSSP